MHCSTGLFHKMAGNGVEKPQIFKHKKIKLKLNYAKIINKVKQLFAKEITYVPDSSVEMVVDLFAMGNFRFYLVD